MVRFYILCILAAIQACCCQISQVPQELGTGNSSMKYLVVGQFSVCIHEQNNLSWFKCNPKLIDQDLLFDYDFNEGFLYYFVSLNLLSKRTFTLDSARRVHCQSRNSESSCGLPPDVFDRTDYSDVLDITLDWVHHTLYIIFDKGRSLIEERLNSSETSYGKETPNIIDPLIEPERVAGPAGVTGDKINFVDLQVDPYNKSLFVQLSIGANESFVSNFTTVIIRSDLLAKEPRLAPNKSFSKNMKFHIDVSEQRIYVLDKEVIYTYDYDGREIRQPLNEYPFLTAFTEEFVVFRNTAYSFFSSDQNNYIGYVSLTEVSAHTGHAYTSTLYGGKRKFMLFDVRTKRKMINGEYVCDRKDCPDLCKVLPSGEVCVCRESRAMNADGRCYNCGQSNLTSATTQAMIVGGQSASLRNFPWHSVIYQLKQGDWKQTCGGTLISSTVVLTAAHCVINLENLKDQEKLKTENLMVALGKIYRDWSTNESESEIRLKVKEIKPHPEFLGIIINYANDIALLTLESKVNFTQFVMPACMDFNRNQLPNYATLDAYVPGFGFVEDCGSMCSLQSTDLKYTTSTVISFLDCIRGAQNKSSSILLTLSPDKFCIGDGSVSLVQKGDSGGGLTLAYHGLHYVTGVVSVKFLRLNGDSFVYSYGAFTNVSHHMDWLKCNLPKEE